MKKIFFLFLISVILNNLFAQSEAQLPLKKVVILTSGLAYYEHSGSLNGASNITLPFRPEAMSDALKTLVVNDPSSANPSVTYQSENTLIETLRSLKVDLSDSPNMAVILSRLRGAEVEITIDPAIKTEIIQEIPSLVSYKIVARGRILSVDYDHVPYHVPQTANPRIVLSTQDGIKSFDLNEVSSLKFSDPEIEQDINRALDLIAASRNSFSRQLMLSLPGANTRAVSLSYVIPSPVWKVSYRLDLGSDRPVFQGWAIVDNDSDTDWNNVELSLVAGRPVSFVQNLYPPYYVARPVLPLSIAGTAQAQAHDRGTAQSLSTNRREMVVEESYFQLISPEAMDADTAMARSRAPAPASTVAGGAVETASGSDAGGQFEFTIRNPVTLNRRMSAMFPLVESRIPANKTLIYNGRGKYPRLGAEITNNSGMKLPAGPITVYDGGVYAGDALIEFWNEGEKRFISFGEDLSVSASMNSTNATVVSSVNISGGVMTINRTMTYTTAYNFINSTSSAKQLIVEKNKIANTTLASPNANEQTTTAYRFNVPLPANKETVFEVKEQRPLQERITLLSQRPENILSYSTNQEIPERVRRALTQAVDLRRAVERAEAVVREGEATVTRLTAEQDRVRRNLEAVGNTTTQGQEYLRRLTALDGEIDSQNRSLNTAIGNVKTANQAYESYLQGLNL